MARPASVTRPEDFREIFVHGRKVSDGETAVFALRSEAGAPTQLGLAVRAPSAVERNRVKRRLRAAFAAAHVPLGTRIVARSRPSSPEPDFQRLVKLFARAAGEGR